MSSKHPKAREKIGSSNHYSLIWFEGRWNTKNLCALESAGNLIQPVFTVFVRTYYEEHRVIIRH